MFSIFSSEMTPDLWNWTVMNVRWVIWTLAAHERRHTAQYYTGGFQYQSTRLLTLSNVMDCILYRIAKYTNNCKFFSTTIKSATATATATETAPVDKRFWRKGNLHNMSPLQRCSDVCMLLWPLVLCIAIRREKSGSVMDELYFVFVWRGVHLNDFCVYFHR
jgi:hypothetical protein